MKKQIKKLFKQKIKPEKSFEEWARDNNIVLPQSTPAPIKNKFVWRIATVFSLLIFAILLPFLFDNPEPQEKHYNSLDIVSISMTLEEIYEIDNLLLFGFEQVIKYNRANIDLANDNENLKLSYALFNCLITTSDGANAFYVDYRVRLYRSYEFNLYQNYTNLTQSFAVNNTQVNFKIIEGGLDGDFAYISFMYQNLEYFLCVAGFEGVTDIMEDTLKILLSELLI